MTKHQARILREILNSNEELFMALTGAIECACDSHPELQGLDAGEVLPLIDVEHRPDDADDADPEYAAQRIRVKYAAFLAECRQIANEAGCRLIAPRSVNLMADPEDE